MQLTVRDVARLFSVSEKTVYHWISAEDLPAYLDSSQYRFNRVELLEWAASHRRELDPSAMRDASGHNPAGLPLSSAIEAGGIHYDVEGADKESVLRAVIARMGLPQEHDREELLQIILNREALGSTAIGDGIAIPHVRNPIVVDVSKPVIVLSFLKTPIEFDAVDGKPVHTLFMLLCPTIRGHLQILSQLAFALRESPFRDAVLRRATAEVILEEALRMDLELRHDAEASAESGK